MTDIFISYKREDRQKARAIAEALAKTGLDVWWDIELLPGQKFTDEINAVIDQAKAVIVLWTPQSIASHWVLSEATHALRRDILIPAWIEHVELPVPFNTLHTLDLTGWNGTPVDPLLEGLIAGIQRLVGQPKESLITRSQSEIETVLTKPAHEVEFWTSVSKKEPQSVDEYRLYLEKYGSNGVFSALAKLRISKLSGNAKKKRLPSVAASLTILGVVVGIIWGTLQIKQIIWPNKGSDNAKHKIETKILPEAEDQPTSTDYNKEIVYEGDLLVVETESGRAAIAFEPNEDCSATYKWKYLSPYFNRWVQGYGEVLDGIGYSYSFEKRQRNPLEAGIVEAGQVKIKSKCRDKKSVEVYGEKSFKKLYVIKDRKLENYEFYLSEQEKGNPDTKWSCHCFLNNSTSKILATFSPSTPVGNRGTFDSQVIDPETAFNRCGPIEFVIGYEVFTGNPISARNPFHHLGGLIWPTLDSAKKTKPFKNCSKRTFQEILNNKYEESGFWVIDFRNQSSESNDESLGLFSTVEYANIYGK